MGVGAEGLRRDSRVWGFGVQGLGFRVQGLGFRVQDLGFRVFFLPSLDVGMRCFGFGFIAQGFRVSTE